MKKILLLMSFAAILWSCDGNKEKSGSTNIDSTIKKMAVDQPYNASYSSSFTDDVSDADLKAVLMSYKHWADGNMSDVSKDYGDSLAWDKPNGEHYYLPNADIMKKWGTYRDSLSSVTIDMQAWRKMYATDKKESFIVAWYKEIDTYKVGNKVDSAYYQDINQLKNGKIIWLSQYRRDAK